MTKDCIAAGCPYFSNFLSNFWAGDKFAYGSLATMSVTRPRHLIRYSLPMHAFAEKIPDDGLNSPFGSGKGCLRVDINWKYFNNAIYANLHMFLTNQRRNFWARKFWWITSNSPNSPKFSFSKILYHTVL